MKNAEETKWIVIAAGGAVATALLPYHIVELRSLYKLRVSVAITSGALNFVTETALRAVTGNQVYTPSQIWDDVRLVPIHLSYSVPDLLIVFPATARVIVEAAIGSITCPVTRLIAFTEKEKVLICPAIHPRMISAPYLDALSRLTKMGCLVPEAPGLMLPWSATRSAIEGALGVRPNLGERQDFRLYEDIQL